MPLSKHVLLIHGWSARRSSMEDVAQLLRENGFNVVPMLLGEYPSLYDDVRVEDVARRMDKVITGLQAEGTLAAQFHVVVHSTGAFVTREWIADLHAAGKSVPVQNFLMLAPANHGSPLATYGRSALGRMLKFNFSRGFQSGEELLHALELGSAYQQQLDLRDRLSRDGDTASPYGNAANKVRPYVIVGAQPIDGTTILNQNGWDGTVRIAGANFDPRGVTVDFTKDKRNPEIKGWTVRGPEKTAFAVLPDRTHLTILNPTRNSKSLSDDPEIRDRLRKMIVEALSVENAAQYNKVQAAWQAVNDHTRRLAQSGEEAEALRQRVLKKEGDRIPSRYNEHYQVVLDVKDDTPFPVGDYFLWLTAPSRNDPARGLKFSDNITAAEIKAHTDVLRNVHVNRRASNRRVLHLDRMELKKKGGFFDSLDYRREHMFVAGITVSASGSKISFFDGDTKHGSGFIPLRAEETNSDYNHEDRFLRRYATHYIEIIVPRIADDDVFSVEPYSG